MVEQSAQALAWFAAHPERALESAKFQTKE
jgi:hypothetical protein